MTVPRGGRRAIPSRTLFKRSAAGRALANRVKVGILAGILALAALFGGVTFVRNRFTASPVVDASDADAILDTLDAPVHALRHDDDAPAAEGEATAVRALPPAWVTGGMEKPAGKREVDGVTMLFYTEEQQARLGVDEQGNTISPTAPPAAPAPPLAAVVDDFPAAADALSFSIAFGGGPGGAPVAEGALLGKAATRRAPSVSFVGRPGARYTLVMVDPDAPSPTRPTNAEWLHWIAVNLSPSDAPYSGGKGGKKGGGTATEVVKYAGPGPPAGAHRYMLVLFEQPEGAGAPAVMLRGGKTKRAKFSTRAFAAANRLRPVAGTYFVVAKKGTSGADVAQTRALWKAAVAKRAAQKAGG